MKTTTLASLYLLVPSLVCVSVASTARALDASDVVVGYKAGWGLVNGTAVTDIGYFAGGSDSSSNTGIGSSALGEEFFVVGTNNVGVGRSALSWTAGSQGPQQATATGVLALTDSNGNIGFYNTANGYHAVSLSGGGDISGFGLNVLLTSQIYDTAIGTYALSSDSGVGNNVAIGWAAMGQGITAGNGCNVAIGEGSQNQQMTSSHATAVGGGASANFENSTAFGFGALAPSANSVRLGNNFVTYIGGPVANFNTSDARFKKNIKENVPGLSFITKLNPVTFQWDMKKLASADHDGKESNPLEGKVRHSGFLAQEVEAAATEVGFDFSGVAKPNNEQGKYSLAYGDFVVPLVKAIQEQQAEIRALNGAIAKAKARRKPQRAGLTDSAGTVGLLGACLVLLQRRRKNALLGSATADR